jgi:hypothetical protein
MTLLLITIFRKYLISLPNVKEIKKTINSNTSNKNSLIIGCKMSVYLKYLKYDFKVARYLK